MNLNKPPRNPISRDIAVVAARWLLGALFLWMGLEKALHPVDFLKLLHQYNLAQSPVFLNTVAAALPWFEAFCGLLLLLGVAVRGTALMLLVMLLPFSYVVLQRALALHSALSIPFCAVKFDCGCGAGEVFICRKLLENTILIILACWLLFGRGRQLCLRYSLERQERQS